MREAAATAASEGARLHFECACLRSERDAAARAAAAAAEAAEAAAAPPTPARRSRQRRRKPGADAVVDDR